jgi:hypothetical protein
MAQIQGQGIMHVDVIRQHRGPVQVTRAVRVKVPGKHFPQLTGKHYSTLTTARALSLCPQGSDHEHYDNKTQRFNLRAFWAEHKLLLPLHHRVYISEVGCNKSAAANVESVFSGAGKFTEEVCTALPAHSVSRPTATTHPRLPPRCVPTVLSPWPAQAKSVGPILLQRMVRLHYNWKYPFLRPTILQVTTRYNAKWHPAAPTVPIAVAAGATATTTPMEEI